MISVVLEGEPGLYPVRPRFTLVCQELRGIGTRHAAGEIKDAHSCKRGAHITSFLLDTWTDTPHSPATWCGLYQAEQKCGSHSLLT